MSKVITACEAANLIPDGATVAMGGFCGFGSPYLTGMDDRIFRDRPMQLVCRDSR